MAFSVRHASFRYFVVFLVLQGLVTKAFLTRQRHVSTQLSHDVMKRGKLLSTATISTISTNRISLCAKANEKGDDDDLIQFELVSSISDIQEEDWDKCLTEESSPFLQHSFLRCLEEGGCATVESGWMPSHVVMKGKDERILGFVPVSEGNVSENTVEWSG